MAATPENLCATLLYQEGDLLSGASLADAWITNQHHKSASPIHYTLKRIRQRDYLVLAAHEAYAGMESTRGRFAPGESSLAPQLLQNAALSGFSRPQLVQSIGVASLAVGCEFSNVGDAGQYSPNYVSDF